MNTLKVCGLVGILVSITNLATMQYIEPKAYQKGKEAKMVELAKVFAPIGYENIKAAKLDCEVKANETCQIYGGYAPKSFFMPKKADPAQKKGPL